MKQRLSVREYASLAVMLFGMFFGAGNLIFPVYLGQMAGRDLWTALSGFLITGVGLPLLGVAALGLSRSSGLFDLSCRVGRPYGYFFTCGLYLTIGPCFAIPRCATTAFTVGLEQLLPSGAPAGPYLLGFSVLFFGAALSFSLRPGEILTYVGKLLTPCFLVFLGILAAVTLSAPSGTAGAAAPLGAYAKAPFFTGFLEGYNTMDALASLAFGIVVVQAIRDLGVRDPAAVAAATVRSGVFSCLLMAAIYGAVALMGARSRGALAPADNGGTALAQIALHYLGRGGSLVLAATVTLACLKTAVGLIASCAETFASLFPGRLSYRGWVLAFTAASCLFANVGLSAIIAWAVPVLMFLYPLAITLILLALSSRLFRARRSVFCCVTGLTFTAAVYDFLRALPPEALDALGRLLPLSHLGLGWVCPAALGALIAFLWERLRPRRGGKG